MGCPVHDPYRELRAAWERGKVIRFSHPTKLGATELTHPPSWSYPPECYTIDHDFTRENMTFEELIQAERLGQVIQHKGFSGAWRNLPNPVWDDPNPSNYRVRPNLERKLASPPYEDIKAEPDPYADLKTAHAKGATIESYWLRADNTKVWQEVANPQWHLQPDRYRVRPDIVPLQECQAGLDVLRKATEKEPDPYAELKKAFADGKIIETSWFDIRGRESWRQCRSHPRWYFPPDRYRIRPSRDEDEIEEVQEDVIPHLKEHQVNAGGVPVGTMSIIKAGKGISTWPDAVLTSDNTWQVNETKPKKEIKMKFETKYYLNNHNIEDLSDQEIYNAIARAEKEILDLSNIKSQPVRLKKDIASRQAHLAELVAYLDSRDEAKK